MELCLVFSCIVLSRFVLRMPGLSGGVKRSLPGTWWLRTPGGHFSQCTASVHTARLLQLWRLEQMLDMPISRLEHCS